MVADDLVFITGDGERQAKADFIDGWTAPGDKFDPITLVDRAVRPLGPDAGLVSAETTLSGTSGGQRFSSRFRFSDTFERTNGQWQAVHIQVTRIPNDGFAPLHAVYPQPPHAAQPLGHAGDAARDVRRWGADR